MQTSSNQTHKQIEQLSFETLTQLKSILSSHLLFHFSMLFAISMELLMIFSLYIWYPTSTYLAVAISVVIFSFFAYLIFSYYFHAKKPEQLLSLKEMYLEECSHYLSDHANKQQSLSSAIFSLIYILDKKPDLWNPLRKVPIIKHMLDPFTGKDLHFLQEGLMLSAIDIQTAQIKISPLNIQYHSNLAKTYIAMSKIYKNQKLYPLFKSYYQQRFDIQFSHITKLAIEELKIIDRLSPDDPWVQAQLAYCYRNLKMKQEEIHQYEKLNHLRPGDETILYRLGKLYLEINQHADALIIYEKLFHLHPQKAQELMQKYDDGIKEIFAQM
ncbi:MAG: hypothetical protein HY860_03955 [Chlamydiales bacterium]|nr:hypothetical protein [Chlamydiales bacterium]